ncbi:heme exporter protein CcmB [Stakelama sp. CBK3Z-3]|uniref:Heme exporter protein B n=1 Tax=Stakelama flava TaxID=2860338 RepID=A0ABS6XLJ3_9SPHN|nr:heme exporter protein CcmB [Stakelama flava]MBW4331079.1 heme exporter protein CcmB [Stakelama flava]
MSGFVTLVRRELRRAWIQGGMATPIAFFLLVAILFPFGIGPDGALLLRVGGAVVWTAALLAALLPVERLIAPDIENGTIDQLVVRGMADATIAAAKMVGHWLGFAPLLMLASVIAGALLGTSGDMLVRIEIGLLIGSPGLAALGVATAALTAGLRGAGALAGLVMLPLAVPLLIFGAGSIDGGPGALKLLGAVSLLFVAGAPFVAAAAMKLARA